MLCDAAKQRGAKNEKERKEGEEVKRRASRVTATTQASARPSAGQFGAVDFCLDLYLATLCILASSLPVCSLCSTLPPAPIVT